MSLVGFKSSNHPQQVGKRGATDRDNLGTDPALFAKLDERFHFTLDVAATSANAKCERYFDLETDGLLSRWKGRVWCNPPYSQLYDWVWNAWDNWKLGDCQLIVMLVPANRPEQRWWQELVEPNRDRGGVLRTEFLRGRQRFVMPGAEAIGPNERPPFGCCLLIWEPVHSERYQPRGLLIDTTHPDKGAPFTIDLLRRSYVAVDQPNDMVVVRLSRGHDDETLTWEYNFASFKTRVESGWLGHLEMADRFEREASEQKARADTAEAEVARLRGLITALSEQARSPRSGLL